MEIKNVNEQLTMLRCVVVRPKSRMETYFCLNLVCSCPVEKRPH